VPSQSRHACGPGASDPPEDALHVETQQRLPRLVRERIDGEGGAQPILSLGVIATLQREHSPPEFGFRALAIGEGTNLLVDAGCRRGTVRFGILGRLNGRQPALGSI
jgi:hypothetical protein